jgi:hypothetical protein
MILACAKEAQLIFRDVTVLALNLTSTTTVSLAETYIRNNAYKMLATSKYS